tara:strand:+ start:911 stop:1090 length:180 start_codon:yes stop_codon:yes gene_type:complete
MNIFMEATKVIIEKLDNIKSELDYIKEHMVDVDTILTDDDIQSIQEAEKDFSEGKTKRL